MLKLIGLITVVWLLVQYGVIQLIAVWAMVALSYVAML
jgi:hypothetical protein